MKRDPVKLTNTIFDLLIIGAGINGTCAAWDATLRGLSVAIIDKGDFGAATSANSLKFIHGGLRYLQKADFQRTRMSIQERSALLRIAPNFVNPMPCLIPTYGHYKQGKEVMRLALKTNDLFGFDRNSHIALNKHIPNGKILSKDECLKLFPYFNLNGLTGGAMWYDCQVSNSERLTLSFLLSAEKAGANPCNYLEVISFIKENNNIKGVKVVDVLTGDEFEIYSRIILNAAGPWVNRIMELSKNEDPNKINRSDLALAINIVFHQTLIDVAIGMRSKTSKECDHVCGGNRFLFMAPWGEFTLFGTLYKSFCGDINSYNVPEDLIQELIDEFNEVCPGLHLIYENVSFYHRGLIPIHGKVGSKTSSLIMEHSNIIDHTISDGISGLISIVGVKYTTARHLAQKAIDLVFKRLGKNSPPCKTERVPICGGEIVQFQGCEDNHSIPQQSIKRLLDNYGSCYKDVLQYAQPDPSWEETIVEDLPVLRCEILHSIRAEMAVKLSDVIFRRTELGTAGCPSLKHLKVVAKIMAAELHWDEKKQAKEIDEVISTYSPLKITENAA
ncbi:MAG: glycerol-3-phosphate dehydrogenase/oxidase [Planctomycetota bacterium]|jgi:glycerol-3-phosphate dehydrogenase